MKKTRWKLPLWLRKWALCWRTTLDEERLGREWLVQELEMERKTRKRDRAEMAADREKIIAGLEKREEVVANLLRGLLHVIEFPDKAGEEWVVTVRLPAKLRDRASMDERDWRLLVAEYVSAAVLADLTRKDPT